jgi:hypothetical protein
VALGVRLDDLSSDVLNTRCKADVGQLFSTSSSSAGCAGAATLASTFGPAVRRARR